LRCKNAPDREKSYNRFKRRKNKIFSFLLNFIFHYGQTSPLAVQSTASGSVSPFGTVFPTSKIRLPVVRERGVKTPPTVKNHITVSKEEKIKFFPFY